MGIAEEGGVEWTCQRFIGDQYLTGTQGLNPCCSHSRSGFMFVGSALWMPQVGWVDLHGSWTGETGVWSGKLVICCWGGASVWTDGCAEGMVSGMLLSSLLLSGRVTPMYSLGLGGNSHSGIGWTGLAVSVQRGKVVSSKMTSVVMTNFWPLGSHSLYAFMEPS